MAAMIKKQLLKSKFFFALFFVLGCGTKVVVGEKVVTQEEVTVRGTKIIIKRNCEMILFTKDGKSLSWKFPANGPCFLAKNKDGSIETYKDMRKSPDSLGMILVHSAELVSEKSCLGMNAGILLFQDRIVAQNPPYTKYNLCIDEKGAFDQKHYATSLNAIIYDKKQNVLKFK